MKEVIDDFRIRKIKWAIDDKVNKGESLSVYKIQLHAGFGGNNKKVQGLIIDILEEGFN
ncbi:hypothetical protein QNH47_12675 [Virgibacillus halodenitrificans]|uniref:hypothetical protein n=1 Tax=Virgibacillus halodenitrificans TaxID=1482 RepID=UPI0024C05EDB|nr:hypothetical protein [Virgibacillus halodenitrificans]WHX25022.1 hypothetical protein QNH47_12675 [Virgibacillus halodenitrificans]